MVAAPFGDTAAIVSPPFSFEAILREFAGENKEDRRVGTPSTKRLKQPFPAGAREGLDRVRIGTTVHEISIKLLTHPTQGDTLVTRCKMTRLDELKRHLRPGRSYRRADLTTWSKSVDRDLQALVQQGFLKKLKTGMYYRPRQSVFGEVPVDDRELVRTFLKDDRFLLTSPNAYNSLGLATTQLYNKRLVYNHKRHGDFDLGGRTYSFRMKHHFPARLSEEFLLVDLMNNLEELAEDRELLHHRVRERASVMDRSRLGKAAHDYGTLATRRFFEEALASAS